MSQSMFDFSPLQEGDELFRFMGNAYNVTLAMRIIEEACTHQPPRIAIHTVPLQSLTPHLGIIRIDKEHAETVDVNKPGILVRIGEGEQQSSLLIDGYHRLYQLAASGAESMDCYYIYSDADLKAISLNRQ